MIRSLVIILTFVFMNISHAATYDEYCMDSSPIVCPRSYTGNCDLNHNSQYISRYTPQYTPRPAQNRTQIYDGYGSIYAIGGYHGYNYSYRSHHSPYYYHHHVPYYRSMPIYSYQYGRPMYRIEQIQRQFDLQRHKNN